MATQVESMARAQRDKWEILGCKPIWERGTVRLPQLMKVFPADLVVTVRDRKTNEYKPFMLRSGRPLRASEILPERADLALDEKGRLLDQMEFEQNYMAYLDSFVMAPGSEIQNEPIPNVARYVNAKVDPWGESRGTVEIDFEPDFDRQFVPKKLIDANGNDAELTDMKALLAELTKRQIGQNQIDADHAPKAEAVEGVKLSEIAKSATPDDRERMPCGAWKKKGYMAQHMRHCNHELCGGPGVNVTDKDAA